MNIPKQVEKAKKLQGDASSLSSPSAYGAKRLRSILLNLSKLGDAGGLKIKDADDVNFRFFNLFWVRLVPHEFKKNKPTL